MSIGRALRCACRFPMQNCPLQCNGHFFCNTQLTHLSMDRFSAWRLLKLNVADVQSGQNTIENDHWVSIAIHFLPVFNGVPNGVQYDYCFLYCGQHWHIGRVSIYIVDHVCEMPSHLGPASRIYSRHHHMHLRSLADRQKVRYYTTHPITYLSPA